MSEILIGISIYLTGLIAAFYLLKRQLKTMSPEDRELFKTAPWYLSWLYIAAAFCMWATQKAEEAVSNE